MKKVCSILCMVMIIIVLLLILLNKKEGSFQSVKYRYLNNYYLEDAEVDNTILVFNNYKIYRKFIQKYDIEGNLTEEDFKNHSYLAVMDLNSCDSELEINKIEYNESNQKLKVYLNNHQLCGFCMTHYDIYFYEIEKINGDKIKVEKETNIIDEKNCDPDVTYKPILYLYPNSDMNVSVHLENQDNIITSYPKYANGWDVFVNSDGTINYQNRDYYALYWDEYNNTKVDFSEGFYVNREDAIKFLEEKLDYIGLNNREANEFIMYWLPVLEQNEHSLVYFELTDEREKNNKLYISPQPDSLLRINMHIKKINGPVNIKEQKLESFERKGFTVVEWGGTIHKEGYNAR